jgi:hypothetical protein
MKWNAFSFVDPGIAKVKGLLFDKFSAKYWMKLGFVSMFSTSSNFGGGNNSYRMPSGGENSAGGITGNAVNSLGGLQKGVLGLLLGIGLIIGLIFTYIRSVFTFVFIDALVNREFTIGGSWRKNRKQGRSYFWFLILAGLVSLVVMGLIFLPVILQMAELGLTAYFEQFTGFEIFKALLPQIILTVIWMLLFGIFMTLVRDFALPEMYRKNLGVMEGIRFAFKNIGKQKTEVLVYLIAKLLFSMVVGIFSLIVLLVVGVVVLIVSLIVFVPLFWVSTIAGVVLLVPTIVFLIYLMFVITLPFSAFMKYYSLFGYEKLFGVKLLKNFR